MRGDAYKIVRPTPGATPGKLRSRELTVREKAAVIYQICTGDSWEEAYKIANAGTLERAEQLKNGRVLASQWKRAARVQRYYEDFYSILKAREEAAVEKRVNELIKKGKLNPETAGDSERTTGEAESARKKFVDYSDPANQARKLNELINTAADPGSALDALKVIIQGQKADRDAAREQKQARFYLPVTCSQCPLYRKQAEKVTK